MTNLMLRSLYRHSTHQKRQTAKDRGHLTVSRREELVSQKPEVGLLTDRSFKLSIYSQWALRPDTFHWCQLAVVKILLLSLVTRDLTCRPSFNCLAEFARYKVGFKSLYKILLGRFLLIERQGVCQKLFNRPTIMMLSSETSL